ncbi:DUF6308 family protein [Mycobacteroides abscessus]
MSHGRDYPEWRQTWPNVIVQTQTDLALEYLHRYYARQGDQPQYTGARFESMAALNPDPNAFAPADFLAVSMLSVSVPAQAAIRLLERDAETVSRLLARIPSNVDIVDVDPDTLESKDAPAGQLWDLLRKARDGLGPTTTSKLLAAKRPRLLPIWDSLIEQATGLGTTSYWRKFQSVLVDDQRRVWNWLGELRMLSTSAPQSISELRILDILLWMSIDRRTKHA